MITASNVRSQVEQLSLELLNSGLAIDFNVPRELKAGSSTLVTFTNASSISDTFGRFATVFEYKTFLSRREWNVVLFDGALLQLSFTISRGTLEAHRLCYYPCPIVFEREELAEASIEELVDATTSEWHERVRLRSPIRFDFDPKAATPSHAASHLTLSADCCRLEVASPLSLGHFVRFIFKAFYPDEMAAHEFLANAATSDLPRTLSDIQKHAMFVDWRR